MQNHKKAIFYCGVNGSGKSLLRSLLGDEIEVLIVSDSIARSLKAKNSNSNLSVRSC